MLGADPLRLHATTALVLHALALERHDMWRQRIDVGLVDDVLRRRGRGGRRNDGRRGRGSGRCRRRRRCGARRHRRRRGHRRLRRVVVVVVVTTGFGATVVVVVAAPAELRRPRRPRRAEAHRAMRATPARTIDLGSVTLEPINPLSASPRPAPDRRLYPPCRDETRTGASGSTPRRRGPEPDRH